MARRRRRIKINNSSLFACLIILNLLISSSASHHHHHSNNNQHHLHQQQQQDHFSSRATITSSQLQQQHQQQLVPLPQTGTGASSSTTHLCSLLPSYVSKHLKLCKLISQSANADEAVALGAAKGLAECRSQFKSERWNCTHAHGDHHLLTSELAQSVGNKESGFVHAIAAAGIVHSIATACSVGNLRDCACDKTRIGMGKRQEEYLKWGGCSDNIRHGMMFAKHLVELLDAVHLHSFTAQATATTHHHHLVGVVSGGSGDARQLGNNRLGKRSLSSRHLERDQLRGRQSLLLATEQQHLEQGTSTLPAPPLSFCQRNHNISHAVHIQLIKSLLSKNSLEKHQEFRLAMNMHNNKVGRMAVAKNMELKCRCHGLSGSCSLKTCWLTLPNFQVIGTYLKKKYEGSIHLPTAVNLNKLIPMMDRNEISAILSSQSLTPPPSITTTQASIAATAAPVLTDTQPGRSSAPINSEPAPEFAPLVSSQPTARAQLSGHFILSQPSHSSSSSSSSGGGSNNNLSAPTNTPPTHFNYYERHKQQLQVASGNNQSQRSPDTTHSTQTISDEIPENLAPMTQQQYQALLRDMKLCNNTVGVLNAPTTSVTTTSYLTTRDLNSQTTLTTNEQQVQATNAKHVQKKLQQHQHLNNNLNGQHLKNANQHLSQLLHSNKEDLIHLHKSPDYCEADLRHGFSGIQSRVCSDNPLAPDYCDKLCCDRGYQTRVYQHKYKCDCKFQYCCHIKCAVCEKEIKLLVCN